MQMKICNDNQQFEVMLAKYRLLLVYLILMVSAAYLYIAIPSCLQYDCFGDVNAASLAPFKYRVLQPLLEGMFSDGSQARLLFVDTVLQAILTAFTLTGLYVWLKRITTPARATGGVLIFAFAWVCSFAYYFRSLGTSIELGLLVWFLVLIEKRLIGLVALVILASLNRETALLLPFIYFALRWREGGIVRYSLLIIVYVLTTFALHIALGSADHMLGLQGTFEYNLQYLDSGLFAAFLVLPLLAIVVLQYRASSPAYRRLAWVAGGYLAAVLIGGAWNEMLRLSLPALVLTLPIVIGGQNA